MSSFPRLRLLFLAALAAVLLAPAGSASTGPVRVPLGRSEDGRLIVAYHLGNPAGPPVLVVGCIHGDECAGIPIADALEHVRTNLDLWVLPNLNPDGYAAGTRQNARGVDLNRNWSYDWPGGGRPWDVYYPGPRPFSERESRIARKLLLRIRPKVTIWYHQHMDVVWASDYALESGRIYSRVSGIPLYHHQNLPGTAINWQNHDVPGTAAFDVELPAGSLSAAAVRRNVRAVLALGDALSP